MADSFRKEYLPGKVSEEPIESLDELTDDEWFCFHGKPQRRYAFRADREWEDYVNPRTGEEDGRITLHYADGYVGEPPVENVERLIEECRIHRFEREFRTGGGR